MSENPPKVAFTMRAACKRCGSMDGEIRERGAQDCVFCLGCGLWQYNAPRTETGKAVRTVATVHEAISTKQRARIIMRANAACECCGKRVFGTRVELHVAHVISVKRGIEMGLTDDEINDDENLIAACDECNLGIGQEVLPVKFMVNVLMARLRRKGPTA